jgi:hypothetical protein
MNMANIRHNKKSEKVGEGVGEQKTRLKLRLNIFSSDSSLCQYKHFICNIHLHFRL